MQIKGCAHANPNIIDLRKGEFIIELMELKDKLTDLRTERGLTQDGLARELNVSRQTVSKWERGLAIPDAVNLTALGRLYGISLDQLVNGPPPQEEPAPAEETPPDAPPETAPAPRRSALSRRAWAAVLAGCALLAGLATGFAIGAAVPKEPKTPEDGIIWTGAMEWELIDPSAITQDKDIVLPLMTGTINTTVSPFSTKTIRPVSLQSRSVITLNCSCSLLSASMDFGVIDASGRFYFINVKGGSINQAIGISQAGTYQVAVRSNSSQTVRVVGFVND